MIIVYCRVFFRGGVGLTSDDKDLFLELFLNRVLNVFKWFGLLFFVELWLIKLFCELDVFSLVFLFGKLLWLFVLRVFLSMLVRVLSWFLIGLRDGFKVKYICNYLM